MILGSPGYTLGLLASHAYIDWDRRQELGYLSHLTYSIVCVVGLCLSYR